MNKVQGNPNKQGLRPKEIFFLGSGSGMTNWREMIATQPERAMGIGKDADAWFTPGRFAALLAVLLGVTFPDVISGQGTFFQRDFGVFTYPVAHYFRECFWRGELPLWNPLNNFGVPLLAQWNTAVLYPPSLFYLVFPLSWSLGVFNVGHLFLAGMGMYFLARRWTGNSLAASVAGLVFAFNGLELAHADLDQQSGGVGLDALGGAGSGRGVVEGRVASHWAGGIGGGNADAGGSAGNHFSDLGAFGRHMAGAILLGKRSPRYGWWGVLRRCSCWLRG